MPILYKHKHKLHPCDGYEISDKYCGVNMKKKNTLRRYIQPRKNKGENKDSEKGITEI